MPAVLRSQISNAGSGTALTTTITNVAVLPAPGSYMLLAVAISGTTNTVTSIDGGGNGTFLKLTSIVSAGQTLEMWLGYRFSATASLTLTLNRTGTNGTANFMMVGQIIDIGADQTVAPTPTVSAGGTATSTSADPGLLTPALDDLLFAAVVFGTGSASTARTYTGNTYAWNLGMNFGSTRVECGWAMAQAAVASKEVWTCSSVDWAARQVMWTPPAAAPAAALVVKGLDTAAADAASAY